ncbi:VWA domain-containing protein [Luteolibacter sp. AS25]|uniref:VWA domain-containing protein n=1 Tax=Luteolibacter sp. AS25 TaxID=3135776 RepID=UPI00398B2229
MIESFITHFRFAQPLWLLLLLPALLLLTLRRGRGATGAVVFPNLGVLLSLGRKVNRLAWNFGVPLVFTSLVFAIIGMARPVWRNEYQSRVASGIDIVIAFDVSLSMDINDFRKGGAPLRRIDAAKLVVDSFISRRPDDRIGLVAFAGRPVSVSPITLDHDWLRQGLDDLKLHQLPYQFGTVEEQGTAIGSALATAATRLDNRDAKSKIIVLITDGASNSGKIAPVEAAEHIQTLGIKTYTVAIGTKEGRVSGRIQRFPRQEFDLPTLEKIAKLTRGEHFWAQSLEDLEENFQTIDNLEKTVSRSITVTDDRELYPWFVGISLVAALGFSVYITLNRSSS